MLLIRQTIAYAEWFDRVRDRQARARIDVRVRRLGMGNPGQHRVLTGGVVEMKIDYGPGYRVYYTSRGSELILLLIGGDKSSQHEDIQAALRMVKELG
jgi:putative addiction module killer protein